MSISGPNRPQGTEGFDPLGAVTNAAASALSSAAAIVRGTAPARPAIGTPAAAQPPALPQVYGTYERFLNGVARTFGKDRELDELSEKLVSLKDRAFGDQTLTPAEAADIRKQMDLIQRAYDECAAKRGYPQGAIRPTSKDAFRVYEEQREIHFQYLAGKDLRSGALGELGRSPGNAAVAKKIAFDIVTSASPAIAADKIHLVRAQLALLDPASQKTALANIGAAIDAEQRVLGAGAVIGRADFDRLSKSESTVAVHETPLPDSVRGTNKLFPNKPIPGWEQTVRSATKASLDDMAKDGKLFLDKIPPGSGVKNVAMKLDLNLGADGPPSVSDPAATNAMVSELLERAKAQGKQIRFTVGDSAGGENIAIGRTTMDIMRDTGNYHHALKAGLTFAANEGDANARAALAKINDAERRGVYFGSKDDRVSTPADLAAVEAAASKYVKCVDYDKEGYASVDPQLGPLGLASWGTREFRMAKPWVEADFRVHVARGASNHTLANWTGATKGLIGLHEFGLRPADQSANKMGTHALEPLAALGQTSGIAAVFEQRTGLTDTLAKIAASGDPALKAELRAVEAKWDNLRGNTAAWKVYAEGGAALYAQLKRDRANGMSEPDIMEKMRNGMRASLEAADRVAPGFKQALWDNTHATTRVLMVAARNLRTLIPSTLRDEAVGDKIGLLSQLPYQSDLVLQSQPKMGEGGGPDAYHTVKDVGVVIAGTSENATDAVAWKRSGRTDNMWSVNYPVHAALRYGRGPMNLEEIRDVTGRP